jgi:hypothetical protein
MHEYAETFNRIFSGYENAFGTFELSREQNEEKKKGRALTIRGPLSLDHWSHHLFGTSGLGIVPLRADNTLCFGAIDIDDYQVGLGTLNEAIISNNLPLVPFRSKSGGAHLYLFTDKPKSAKVVREALSRMANILGFGKAEIFPKQDARPDPDSVGNWLNMPYFYAEGTDRYAIDQDGNAIPIENLEPYIEERRVNDSAIEHYTNEEKTTTEKKEPLSGGPPCLNTLLIRGFPPNTRNNTLFNLGVYAKKSHPDSWEQLVEDYNRDFIDPPLDYKEVGAVIKSLAVKDYNYKCKDSPINSVCNKTKCMVCRYGVRPDDEIPKLGKLIKILTEPPVWQIEVIGGGTLELSTEELQTPRQFQKRCMETLNVMPPMVKADQWREIIAGLLENLKVIEVPKESSPTGRLIDHLRDFLTGRVQAKKKTELLAGKPLEYDDRHYFRMRDFYAYLDKVKFTDIKQNKVLSIIKSIPSVEHPKWNISGSYMNLWSLPLFKKVKDEDQQD